MKKIFLYILLSISFLTHASAQEYIALDIPAMKDMAVDEPIEMDSAEGAITNYKTSAPVKTKQEVLDYYNQRLKHYGWNKVNPYKYTRNGETLDISIEDIDHTGVGVNFTITTPFE
ncbi:MAG: hypothetical protein ACPG8V_04345 [Alphaproteobacteria bacterium]